MSRHDLIEAERRLAAILCSVAGTTPTNVFARDPPAQRGRRPHFGMSPDLELKIDDLLQKTALPSLEFALLNNVDAACGNDESSTTNLSIASMYRHLADRRPGV